MNNLPFISGMRATPRRIVKSFFIATAMGFLIVNMNLLLRTGDEEMSGEYGSQNDPNFIWPVNINPNGNGVEPIEPQQHTKNSNNDKLSLPNNSYGSQDNKPKQRANDVKIPQTQTKVQVLPNFNNTAKNRSGDKSPDNIVRDRAPSLPPSDNNNTEVPSLILDLIKGPHNPVSQKNASFIKHFIKKINREQKIHNLGQ